MHDRIRNARLGERVMSAEEAADEVFGTAHRAKGREWPLWLVLGRDAYADVRAKTAKLLETMKAWEDVATDVEFDCEPALKA